MERKGSNYAGGWGVAAGLAVVLGISGCGKSSETGATRNAVKRETAAAIERPPGTVEERVRALVAELLGSEVKLLATDHVVKQGKADSLDLVELVMAVEEEFGIEIRDGDAVKLVTISNIVEHVSKSMAPLFKLSETLPTGLAEIELMTIQYTARAQELTLKLQAALATNQAWFSEHVRKARPGEPLDYDPRLGVTKEEWEEYLRESEDRRLASTGKKLMCLFRRDGEILSLDIGETNSPLSKIRLNVETGEFFAWVGRVGMPIWRSNDNPKSPVGPHEACSWKYEKSDLEKTDIRVIGLDIWRLKSSGRILWRLRDSETVKKQTKRNFEMVFQHWPRGGEPKEGSPE